jgi:hypothetical protein
VSLVINRILALSFEAALVAINFGGVVVDVRIAIVERRLFTVATARPGSRISLVPVSLLVVLVCCPIVLHITTFGLL